LFCVDIEKVFPCTKDSEKYIEKKNNTDNSFWKVNQIPEQVINEENDLIDFEDGDNIDEEPNEQQNVIVYEN
jgi:hypothetical protein